MTRKEAATCRVQAYIADPKIVAGLHREARTNRIPLSQAAGRAIARGLQKGALSDDEHRLSDLKRSLQDHMKSSARDLQIIQELLIEVSRILFQRSSGGEGARDPLFQAAVDRRAERLLSAAAERIAEGDNALSGTPVQKGPLGAAN